MTVNSNTLTCARKRSGLSCSLIALSLSLLPTGGLAQETSTSEQPQVFEAAFFERFAPQTGRDMVFRIPGFSVRNTSDGRGLGQGGSNVLINGERVTSKSTDALAILNQTPASSVIRIEITDAATLGVTGLTGQVANVVLERDGLSGAWDYNFQARDRLEPRVSNGSVSLSGSFGDTEFSLGLSNNSFRNGHKGPERVYDGNRQLTEVRDEDAQYYGEAPEVTASLSGGKTDTIKYNLTASAALFQFDGSEVSKRANDLVIVSKNSEDEWNAEGSADFTKTLGPGDAKIIAYHRFEHSPFFDRQVTSTMGQQERLDTFEQIADETETILRGEYIVPRPNDRSWELAAEYAFNRLDTESTASSDVDGFEEVTPLDPVNVEELRYQTSLTHSRKLGDLAVQLSAGAEYSEIQSVTGNTKGEKRSFSRPRGYVTFAYPFSEDIDLRGRIERSVGQLDFFAFVSSQNLREGVEEVGNTNLVPQQSWDTEWEIEKRFGEEEKLILRTESSFIEDRVDQVVINGEQAIGNIDEARFFSIEAEGTFLLDRFGIEGARIDLNGARRWSRLEDPITGENRPFSGSNRWFVDFNFRHDIPNTNYAYGGYIGHFEQEDRVTARQRSVFMISEPGSEIFIEHKDVFGMLLTVAVFNLFDQDERFNRTFYEGLREQSDIAFIEERSRDYKPIFALSLSGTF